MSGEVETDPDEVARTILLDQLSVRARSRRELADKLRAKGVADDVAERLLDRFTEIGLVDDGAFAVAWVESRVRSKGLGRRALAHELRGKGVAPQHVEAALESVDDDSEEKAARALVRRRLRSLTRLEPAVRRRRLEGLLARKGYGGGLVSRVVREELDLDGEDADGFQEP